MMLQTPLLALIIFLLFTLNVTNALPEQTEAQKEKELEHIKNIALLSTLHQRNNINVEISTQSPSTSTTTPIKDVAPSVKTIQVPVEVLKPYAVHIPHPVPVPVHIKVPVTIEKPYPVHITKTISVPVEKPVYIRVPFPIQVPVAQPYPVAVPQPVEIKVPHPIYVQVPFKGASQSLNAVSSSSSSLLDSYVPSKAGGIYGKTW